MYHKEAIDFPYKPKKLFIMSILINIELGYGIFVYLSNHNELDSSLELMDLQSGQIIAETECNVRKIVKAWEDDYFIDYKR